MTSILAFIFVIGILVFFHELGHFALAKRNNIRVEKFSLGFGPKIFSFTRNETEYMISLFPLGGYVKMYGESAEKNIIVENVSSAESPFLSGDRITGIDGYELEKYSDWEKLLSDIKSGSEPKRKIELERDGKSLELTVDISSFEGVEAYHEKEYKRGFSGKSIMQRFMVVIAGPAMNFAIVFILMPIAFMIGISVSGHLEKTPHVIYVKKDSLAEKSGFVPGDTILSVNGKQVKTWRDLNIAVHTNPDSLLKINVKRDGEIKTLSLFAEAGPQGRVETGLSVPMGTTIDQVSTSMPAYVAGMRSGDTITSVNGMPVSDWNRMSEIISKSDGAPLDFTVNREKSEMSFRITPLRDETLDRYVIGITPRGDYTVKKYGFFEAILKGVLEAVRMTVEITVLFFGFLFKLLTGKIALATAGKTIAGPLLIAKISGSAAQGGISNLLQFTSLISVNLALINLLPIPMLDGGHILYLTIEKLRGKSLSLKTLEITQRVGFSFLIVLMAAALYNDILKMRGDIFLQFSKIIDLFR